MFDGKLYAVCQCMLCPPTPYQAQFTWTWSEASFTNAGSFFIFFDVFCQMLGQNMYLMPEYLPWIHLSFINSDHVSSATRDYSRLPPQSLCRFPFCCCSHQYLNSNCHFTWFIESPASAWVTSKNGHFPGISFTVYF